MELWFSECHTPDVKHSLRVNRHLFSKKSEYQQIDIFDTPEFGRVLALDGDVMLTERDQFIYNEMITHIPIDGIIRLIKLSGSFFLFIREQGHLRSLFPCQIGQSHADEPEGSAAVPAQQTAAC